MDNSTARRSFRVYDPEEDHLKFWLEEYLGHLEEEDRPNQELKKTRRMLQRFVNQQMERYSHDKVTAVVTRDVNAWLAKLYEKKEHGGFGFAPSYVNGHQIALSAFIKWLQIRVPHLMKENPMKGAQGIHYYPEPEGRALLPQQILSLKNICDRLEYFHLKTDRRRMRGLTELKSNARPLRDRAIVYVGLSTGLRRHELVMIDLDQVVPNDPEKLRVARGAKIVRVRGKRKTERTVFLSADARAALADYLEKERPMDSTSETTAVFLSAIGTVKRKPDGQMHPRSINKILEQIGLWHDAELADSSRHISPLKPHDLRHSCASELRRNNSEMTDEDIMQLMGWRDKQQIPRYTRAKEELIASFVEEL
ncbi:tyrosine-type recombinase/integrase [Paenibacillus elgii]|uniref:tyrosine-type recombinase/integrase n=1 Tax=Paenibacillus elgii TaxID=189691 RepID=UPI0013D37FB4|nr:tyrosine-type recombinase/integrase [Paenibacillus elgii]